MTDLPQGWREVRLGEVADVLDSKRKPVNSKERAGRAGSVPYYGATGQVGTIDTHLFDEELVLLGEDGAPFLDLAKPKAYLISGKSWVNNHAHVLRCREGAYTNTLLVHFLNDLNYLPYVNGTTRLKLTQGSMNEIPVTVPPLAEQERIVEILEEQFSRLDSALASIKAVREKSKAFRRSLLHSAFSGELTGGTEGWREVALGDISVVKGGKRLPKGTKWSPNPTAHPYIRATDVQATGIDTKGLVYVPDEVWAGIARYVVASGDVVITIAGTIGRTAVVSTLLDGANLTENAAKIVLNKSVVSSWFLDYFLKSPLAQEVIESLSTSTTQAKLALFRIETIAIPLPPLATQERIVSLLEEQFSRLDKALEVANQLEARIASERRSLLHSAFTGALTATWRQNND